MNKSQIIEDLSKFINIESVSGELTRFSEILKAVKFLEIKLKDLGFKVERISAGENPPLIIANKFVSSTAKTIGIYGHYDVQPEDPLNEWKTTPFELKLSNGKFYGRGVADNKGHIIQNLAAIEELISLKSLANNIVLIFEGEEENGSVNFENYIDKVRNELSKVDVFFITDMGMRAKNIPYIFYALRGLDYFELEISIGARDLHSGVYGNRVLNPINIIADLLAKMKNVRSGKILIPGFYEDVRKSALDELKLLEKISKSDDEEVKEANSYGVVSVDSKRPYLSNKIYPSLDAHGIVGGYIAEGSKTIIPAKALLKFSTRLVENQNPDRIENLMKQFVKDNLPPQVRYKLITHSKAAPFYTSLDDEYVLKTANIFKEVFGNQTLFNRSGGSVPAAEILQRNFKRPIILTGFTLPDDNIHAPNENFDEEMFWKGIEALKSIYSRI